jgi:hypothetical protein
MADGVGLERARKVLGTTGEADQPEHQAGKGNEEQKHLDALRRAAAGVAKAEAETMRFAVAKSLLDLHASRVEIGDPLLASRLMRE